MRDYHFYSSTVLLAECIFHLFGIETKISSFYTSKSAVSCPSVLSQVRNYNTHGDSPKFSKVMHDSFFG